MSGPQPGWGLASEPDRVSYPPNDSGWNRAVYRRRIGIRDRDWEGEDPGRPVPDSFPSARLPGLRGLDLDGRPTVGDLRRTSDAELLRSPNFGRKTLARLRRLLDEGRPTWPE